MKKILVSLLSFLCCAPLGVAGSITGQIQTPSTGRGVPDGTLTFTLSQVAVISGTAALAANGNCWTDTNGNVVGLPGDAAVAAPVLSSNLGSGSLGAGTYFVRYTWANATGESQPSAERSLALTSSGTLIVQAPASVPSVATAMKIYIGTAAGAETLQGSVAVTNGLIGGNYNQASGLATGAVLPSNNTSVCQIRFNDELQPSYTGYSVAFTNVNGAGIAGFPQKWYLSGGSSGTVNVGVGLPLYSGVVVYPQPIISNPAANGMQSINGPLNMNGFAILNTVIANPNGAIVLPEIAPPSGVANNDVLYADSTVHRFKMINNNGAADVLVGANTGDTLTNKSFGDTALLNGSAAITSNPPSAGTNTGWKLGLWGNTFALGIAQATVSVLSNGYFSVFSSGSLPANDSTGVAPDSHAKVTLGADGTVTLAGSTVGSTVIKANASASGTLTLPNSTDTLVGRTTTDTLNNKTIDTAGGNTIRINGNTLSAAAGTATLTLPNSTDTVVARATTDTLTNKTFDTGGAGNVFRINGTQISSVTGSGSVVLATSPVLTTPNVGASSGNTHTFVNQVAPANPPSGSITIYGDSGSGNLGCRNSLGTSCLFATATAPLISTTANPAGTGVVRVASGDTALAFRNNANNGDMGITKNSSDVMDLTAFNGVKLQTLQITTPNPPFPGCAGSAASIYNDASSPNSMNLCFGDGTGWKMNFSKRSSSVSTSVANLSDSGVFTTSVFQTASNNPATSGVLRCAGSQACAVARTPDNTNDVQLGYALNGPLAVFGSISGSTSGVTAEVGELKIDTGVTVQSTGFKHFRLASGTSCTTPGTQGSECTTGSIALPGPAFPDANYTIVCVLEGPSTGSPVIQGIASRSPSSFTLGVLQVGTAASSYGAADCIAVHD